MSHLYLFLCLLSVLPGRQAENEASTTLKPLGSMAFMLGDSTRCKFQESCICSEDTGGAYQHISIVSCFVQKEWPSFQRASQATVERLVITGNFTRIPNSAFNGLLAVTKLELIGIGYTSSPRIQIDPYAFSPNLLSTLNNLSIRDVPVTEIPGAIKNLVALTAMDIKRAPIDHGVLLDNSFKSSSPQQIAPPLKSIILSECGLVKIQPNAFDGQQNTLNTLVLSRNKLPDYPKEAIASLRALTQLELDYNSIETLQSRAFETLYSLGALNLSQNRLKHLPDTVFEGVGANRLQLLDLSGNSIPNLPNSLSSLTNLLTLQLSDNAITNLSAHAFTHLSKLQELNLDNNPITQVERGLLFALTKLNTFKMSNSSLETLELNLMESSGVKSATFSSNKYLETVELAGNPMAIPASLQKLTISSNPKLKYLKGNFGGLLLSRQELVFYFNDNPSVHCSCDLFWMKQVTSTKLRLNRSRCSNENLSLEEYLKGLRAGCESTKSSLSTTTTKPDDSGKATTEATIASIFIAFASIMLFH